MMSQENTQTQSAEDEGKLSTTVDDECKFAYVCFTCKRDEPLLPLHYAAIMRADPSAEVYYQVEQAEADSIVIPEGAYLLPAQWSHNGNLCGLDALKGILHTYKLVADNTGRAVVKIDADTVLVSKGWLRIVGEGKADLVGYAPATTLYCKGTAYAISKQGINAVIEQLQSGTYWECSSNRIEDGVISMLCAIGTDKNRVRILQAKMPDNSIVLYTAFTHAFYSQPDALKRVKAVVDCGDPKLMNLYRAARLDTVEGKRRAMRFTLHAIK